MLVGGHIRRQDSGETTFHRIQLWHVGFIEPKEFAVSAAAGAGGRGLGDFAAVCADRGLPRVGVREEGCAAAGLDRGLAAAVLVAVVVTVTDASVVAVEVTEVVVVVVVVVAAAEGLINSSSSVAAVGHWSSLTPPSLLFTTNDLINSSLLLITVIHQR